MEELKVEIISREDIKPSSPTPSHKRNVKLCLLDHLIPSPYAPIILFYDHPHGLQEIPKRIQLLKHSLSETLTQFYPLAGKIKDDFSIECNDEGANFVHAHVKCSLSEFLAHPNLILLHKLLPCDLMILSESYVGTRVSNVQVNIFNCGGIAIGICISHRILDGDSLRNFLKVWTSEADRSDNCKEEVVKPNLSLASSLFPLTNLKLKESSMAMWGSFFKQGKCVTRRFWFSNTAIATLKDQIIKSSLCDKVEDPTRLLTVSAILWKSLMVAASKAHFGKCNNSNQLQRAFLLSQVVNLRKRIKDNRDHLNAENDIGNLLWLTSAKSYMANHDERIELHGLVRKLRNAISDINDEFVEKLLSDINGCESLKTLIGEAIGFHYEDEVVEHFGFSSWCKFGFYEMDFGWGKPVWVSSIGLCGSLFVNLDILADARFGDGIEAWVTLDDECMTHLEANQELLAYATLDPSVSKIQEILMNFDHQSLMVIGS